MFNLRWAFAIVAGLLVMAAGEGPDFGSYTDWAAAALSGDIFSLRGNVLSPGGVPFTIAAVGPGLLFAIGKAALFPLTLVSAAVAAGWAAALIFWLCAFIVLRRAGGNDDRLALFGTGALFIGTHAGIYSHLYATEVFANALIAALWALALTRERWRVIDAAAVGALAGLLLLVRAHVVLYAVPALWLAVVGEGRPDGDAVTGRPEGRPLPDAWRALAASIPLAIAVGEYATVNRWMTGAWTHPPYLYGGAGFSSVDLTHPQFAAVLAHPLHGLLTYHPLYGIAFAAVVLQAWRGGRWGALWMATAIAVCVHVWVQAGWYIWWLGGTTFGMRGLAPAALPLVAGLVATTRHDVVVAHSRRAAVWIGVATLACAWSFPLLWRGNTQFYTWGSLLSTQMPALVAIVIVAGIFGVLIGTRRAIGPAASDRMLYWTSTVLIAAGGVYLANQFLQTPDPLTRGGIAIGAALLTGGVLAMRPVVERAASIGLMLVVLALFGAQAAVFARLAVRTGQRLAAGAPPPRVFPYWGAYPVDELRVTYREYLEVPGFDREKTAFRRFLQWQRIDASSLAEDDRRVAEAALQSIQRDPLLAQALVELTARSGVVDISAPDMTDAQQSRARELALQVPGVRNVTFSP